MSMGLLRDIGAHIKGFLALIPAVITSGAGDDGVEVDGPWVDVSTNVGEGIEAHGAVLQIMWDTTLTATETLSLLANMQDATDGAGAGAADFGKYVLAAAVVATGGGGGTVETGVTELRIPEFNGNRGFVRAQVTATLSLGATDTVRIAAMLVVGGAHDLPAVSGLQASV